MATTRFYLESSGTPSTSSIAASSNWDYTDQAWVRKPMNKFKASTALTTLSLTHTGLVVGDDFIGVQFVSDQVQSAVSLSSTAVRMVIGMWGTATIHMQWEFRVMASDNTTQRVSTGQKTSANVGTTQASITDNTTATVNIQANDRLVLEVGLDVVATSGSKTGNWRYGSDSATDFTATTGDTNDFNGWFEVDADISLTTDPVGGTYHGLMMGGCGT